MPDDPPGFRPKAFPPPEFPPRRKPLFAQMPPAAFPSILGLLALGLALRRGLEALNLPSTPVDLPLGGVVALWLFAAVGYGVKLVRRPGVLVEDLRVLPGRSGLAAATMGLMAVAAVLAPLSAGLAETALWLGLGLHAALVVVLVAQMRAGPPEGRDVTPVWHLLFVGIIVGGLSAPALGWPELAGGLFWASTLAAAAIWGASSQQLVRRIPPAPLRPILAIHLAPASLLGLVALGLGWTGAAQGFAVLATAIFLALLAAGRWITLSGFSPFWGAFTFPLASYAALLVALGGGWLWPGLALLALATVAVPMIAWRILRAWATGDLARRSNAAVA